MEKDIRIQIANPSGNITIFVLDRFARSQYAAVARGLLAREELEGEQVAFVTGPHSIEMSGLEFCGNASRAFALMIAGFETASAVSAEQETASPHPPGSSAHPSPTSAQPHTITINVSGADAPVNVLVDPAAGRSAVSIPLHRWSTAWDEPCGTLVALGGIMHLVLEDVEPSLETFLRIRERITSEYDPPALGVMFCSDNKVTPIVYVRDVNSIYHEGSCCSGCASVAIARSIGRPDGRYDYELVQPAGTLTASAEVTGGNITGVWIDGTVELSPPQTITLDLPD